MVNRTNMVQDSNNIGGHERASTIGTADGTSDEKRKKVGNYVILRTIGEGSFAKVRLGVHLITEVKVRIISKGVLSSILSSLFSSSKTFEFASFVWTDFKWD